MGKPDAAAAIDRDSVLSADNTGLLGTLTLARTGPTEPGLDPDDEPPAPAGRIVLTSAPKIRAVYLCRVWRDALRPEFYKNRPVVIVSRDNRLDGPVLAVPLTTKPQGTNTWACKLTENPNPRKPLIESWAVRNHIHAVSWARLAQMDGGVPRMNSADFDKIVRHAPRLAGRAATGGVRIISAGENAI